jgi:hypothetical protein
MAPESLPKAESSPLRGRLISKARSGRVVLHLSPCVQAPTRISLYKKGAVNRGAKESTGAVQNRPFLQNLNQTLEGAKRVPAGPLLRLSRLIRSLWRTVQTRREFLCARKQAYTRGDPKSSFWRYSCPSL